MKIERKKSWLSSIIKNTFFLRTRDILANAASNLRHKAKEKSDGFVNLYKDMEACAGYTDIQVMWEMIHSTSPHNEQRERRSRRFKCWKFCFQQVREITNTFDDDEENLQLLFECVLE